MFVAAERIVDVPCPDAVTVLARLAAGGELDGASQTAYQRGLGEAIRVGPLGGVPWASKLVTVRFLEPVERGGVTTLGFRWEATGPAAGLFPVLDADITLTPDGDRTRLTLTGSYRPPLGRVGVALDRLILHRVAEPTMRSLLADIAAALTNPAAVLDLPRLGNAIVVARQEWAQRLCNRALVAWHLSLDEPGRAARAAEPSVSVRLYQDGKGRYVVISGPGAGVRAVYSVAVNGRISPMRTWPDGLTGC